MLNTRITLSTVFLSVLFVITFPLTVYASDYVLPYPSFMPGHKLYAVRQLLEKVQELWYFGDMSRVKYHQQMADKYLVEAETLFNYNQALLASFALQKSNSHFAEAVLYERNVVYDHKDKGEQKQKLKQAGEKHKEILESLTQKLPKEIVWTEEKKQPETIPIESLLKQSSVIRTYATR